MPADVARCSEYRLLYISELRLFEQYGILYYSTNLVHALLEVNADE